MSITQGLFSDVIANAPGNADWSKTLPMAGAVDWTKVSPFQVINPLTGYNYGATQAPQAAAPAPEKAPELTEYQKWLAKQSAPYEAPGSGGSNFGREPGWYESTTPEERAAHFAANPWQAKISEMGMKFWQGVNPWGLASLQEKLVPGMQANYLNETRGYVPVASALPAANPMAIDPAQAAQAQAAAEAEAYQRAMAEQAAAFGGGGSAGSNAPSGPVGGGYAANPMGQDPAQRQGQDYNGGGSGWN